MVASVFNTESMALGALGVIVGATAIGLTGGTIALAAGGALAAGMTGGAAGMFLHQTPEQQEAKYQAHLAHMEEVSKRPETPDAMGPVPIKSNAATWIGIAYSRDKEGNIENVGYQIQPESVWTDASGQNIVMWKSDKDYLEKAEAKIEALKAKVTDSPTMLQRIFGQAITQEAADKKVAKIAGSKKISRIQSYAKTVDAKGRVKNQTPCQIKL